MGKRFIISCSLASSLVNFRGKLLELIRENGHEILAVAPSFDDETVAWCKARNIEMQTFSLNNQGLNPFKDLFVVLEIYKITKRYRPDVVLGYTHKPALYTAFAGWLARVPHVTMMVTGLGFGFETGNWRKALLSKITSSLFSLACRICDHVIFHNADNQNFFWRVGILPKNKASTVVRGSGVDLTQFQPLPHPKATADRLVFLLIARVVRYKGILEFAKAAEILKTNFPLASFKLVGPPDKNPSAITTKEWAYVQKQIEYLGERKDVRGELANCQVFVLPSYGEGMPRTVLEAMASGRAIVTTRAPGCQDTVEEGVNGHLVEPRDSVSLAAALEKFLSGKSDWQKMGAASLALSKEYAVERVNAEMIKALTLG